MENQNPNEPKFPVAHTAGGIHLVEPVVADDTPTIDVRLMFAVLRGNMALIAVIVTAALALALIVTMLQTPRYTAETTVQINDQTQQVLGKEADDNSSSGDVTSPLDTERFLQTQMEIVNGRALAERVAQRLNLIGNAQFYAAMGARPPASDASAKEQKEAALKLLLDNESGELPRNTRLATISFTSTDPAFSAKVANTWASEFIQANLQRRYDSSAYARDFISGQLGEAKAKLEQSERDLNTYARQAGLIKTRDAAQQGGDTTETVPNSVTAASLLQLNYAANQAEQQRMQIEQRWKAVSGPNLLSAPEVLSNTSVATLLTERAKDEADLQRERAKHLEDHPVVQQLKAQEQAIDRQISAIAQSVRNSIKQQYDAAVSAEKGLKDQVAGLKGASLEEQDKSVQYNLLARDADTSRSLYESLLQRYKELNAAAGISASNIAVIDAADEPILPSSPKILRNLAVAFAGGLLLAIGFVVIRHQVDDTVRVPEDIESKLGMPLLGVIPRSASQVPFEDLRDPKSAVSEGYNSLRSALLLSTSHGLPRTLLVTSSQPAEGKSTSSLAIGIGIAKLGRRVVLIDVDMRRPSLHAALDKPNAKGLSSVLAAQASLDEVIQDSPYENLSVISSGPIPPSPTDLLSSTAMIEMLTALTERFDVVMLDSPPVLGLADAPMLAAMVEGVLLVVQSSRSHRGALRSSLRRLKTARTNVLGAVLTMFDPSKTGNRYSTYYGYEYYQYRADAES